MTTTAVGGRCGWRMVRDFHSLRSGPVAVNVSIVVSNVRSVSEVTMVSQWGVRTNCRLILFVHCGKISHPQLYQRNSFESQVQQHPLNVCVFVHTISLISDMLIMRLLFLHAVSQITFSQYFYRQNQAFPKFLVRLTIHSSWHRCLQRFNQRHHVTFNSNFLWGKNSTNNIVYMYQKGTRFLLICPMKCALLEDQHNVTGVPPKQLREQLCGFVPYVAVAY